MGFFSWIVFIFIALPIAIGFPVGILKTTLKDDRTNMSSKGLAICFGAATILIVWSLIDIPRGVFTSLWTASFFLIKAIVGICLLICGIAHLSLKSSQDYWNSRIQNALNGQLGQEIKKYLYNNSYEYFVYNDRIIFDQEGRDFRIEFADLGYKELSVTSADAVCAWIRKNVVAHPELYRIERVHEEVTDYSDYSGGTSDSYTVTKNYSGSYEVNHYSGTPGEFGTKTVTRAYKLTRRPYAQTTQANLKKW